MLFGCKFFFSFLYYRWWMELRYILFFCSIKYIFFTTKLWELQWWRATTANTTHHLFFFNFFFFLVFPLYDFIRSLMDFNGSLMDSICILLVLHVLWSLTPLQILPKSYSKQKPDQKRNSKNDLRPQTVIRDISNLWFSWCGFAEKPQYVVCQMLNSSPTIIIQ